MSSNIGSKTILKAISPDHVPESAGCNKTEKGVVNIQKP